MHAWMRLPIAKLCLLVAVFTVLGPACTSEEAAAPDAAHIATIEAGGTTASTALDASEPRVLTAAEFVATWDPTSERFHVAMLDEALWDTPSERRLRTADAALYCTVRTTAGRPDTFSLGTVAGSIGTTIADCGVPDEFPYSSLGAFCADIEVKSNFATPTTNVYTEITSVTPDTGYAGYAFPFGTGTDPATVPPGVGQPVDIAGGLWAYGNLPPSGGAIRTWILQNDGGAFTFRGRVVMSVTELDNGRDDDCDGVIDNRLGEFAEGDPCTANEDCAGGICDPVTALCAGGVTCGDAVCEGTEDAASCPADCPDTCGDTFCTGTENPSTCPADCPPICGDTVCNGTENASTCSADCPDTCGDTFCTGTENPSTCSADCSNTCGDTFCAGTETTATCPADCGSLCGDATCNGAETTATCPADCGSLCGDATCNGAETPATCPADCGSLCGDATCNGTEDANTCSADCPDICGDTFCTGAETTATCSADCGSLCGDATCNGTESTATCSADCGSLCGDAACNGAEDASTCALDCSDGEICGDGVQFEASVPTTALVSFTGGNCSGNPGDVTIVLNGTTYGPFLATVGCLAGVAPQQIRLTDASVHEALIDGVNTFSFSSTNTGIHWAKIRLDHTGETFVFTEQSPGDAIAETLLPSGPVPPVANETITPTPTFVRVEDCDDGNTLDGDGCSADCKSEVGGFCGDGDVASPGRNDATSVVFSWAAVDCSGAADYEVTLSVNGVDVDTVLGTQACFCGDGVQRYTINDPAVLGTLAGTNDTFGFRAVNGGNTVWAKVEVFSESNPAGDAFVFYERVTGDAANEASIPCSSIDYPVLRNGFLVTSPDVNGPFACDDGNNLSGDGCDENCTLTGCGNGILTAGEFCDDGQSTSTCDLDCTAPVCGDGLANLDAGEGCDDANLVDGDGCSSTCQTEFCADGVVQAALGEQCDDGNNINGDGCNFVCRDELCGDGVLHADAVESCDDGNLVDGDGCSSTCQDECGDGAVTGAGGPITSIVVDWVGFVCNNTNQFTLQIDGEIVHQQSFPLDFAPGTCFCNSTAPIRSYTITDPKVIGRLQAGRHDLVFSGRNIGVTWARMTINGTETYTLFDPSDVMPTQDSCTFQTNGSVDRTVAFYREACDGTDGCNAQCELLACGDGIVEAGEECDDANLTAGDGCDAFCMLESCGNGAIESGEECDDGGLIDGDGCSSICRLERCGNGIADGAEACDDGNLIAGDGCDDACEIEECGNGVTDVGEQCDGGSGCSAGCTILGCVPGLDTDGDRLDDCVETNTGRFVDSNNTGTSALLADSDGDGISDGDEVLGTLGGLNLPALGVSPNRIDILVEIDWTGSAVCTTPTTAHRLTDWEAELLESMFRNAPITNRDGSRGIHLYLDYGQTPAHVGGNYIDTTDDFLDGGVGGVDYVAHKLANFAPERNGYFHYSLAARQFNVAGNSGQAELFGDDMIITPGCGSSLFRAGTYAHELGHNLGLGHGGFQSCNFKPNYISIMNYRHTGLDADCDGLSDGFFDFSSGTMLTIDENAINELDGLCGEPFDFNGNGIIDAAPYALDLNPDEPSQIANCLAVLSELSDNDDWMSLSHIGISDNDGRRGQPTEIITCDPHEQPSSSWVTPLP